MNAAPTITRTIPQIIRGALLALGMAAFIQSLDLQALTLTWRAPESGPQVAGYYLYFHNDSMSAPLKVNVGNVTTYRVNDLAAGNNYSFYVTAYNPHGLESDPSNTFSYRVPAPKSEPQVTLTRVGQYGLLLTWNSVEGRSYFIWGKDRWDQNWSLLTGESVVTAIGPFTSWLTQMGSLGQGFYYVQDLSAFGTAP